MYPKGHLEAKDTHISMYLMIVGVKRVAHFSMCVRNQIDPSKHVNRTSTASLLDQGLGWRKMTALETLQ